MRTKIRLAMDFGIQGALLCFLFFHVSFYPGQALVHLWFYISTIIIWQIIHAIYVAHKYQDWYSVRYLRTVRKIVFVALIFFSSTFVFFRYDYEMILSGGVQVVELVGILLLTLLCFTLIKQFYRSIINLHNYIRKPRSFWDL